MIAEKDVEKEIRELIVKGNFDQVIFDDYEKLVRGEPIKRRRRKPKSENYNKGEKGYK